MRKQSHDAGGRADGEMRDTVTRLPGSSRDAAPASRTREWNREVSAKLREAADLLAAQGANPFRVNAFRRAAETVGRMSRDIREIAEREGPAGLIAIPSIGRGIASAIIEIVATGRWGRLDRLRGELDVGRLFQSVPGIGPAR